MSRSAVSAPGIPRVLPDGARDAGQRYRRVARGPEPMPTLGLVRPSRWARRIAGGLWVLLVVLPLALIFVPWRQSVEGAGRVVGLSPLDREFTVESPIYGRVKKWYVSEGSFVRGPRIEDGREVPGDLIADLTNNDARATSAGARRRRQSMKRRCVPSSISSPTQGSRRKNTPIRSRPSSICKSK